MSNEGSVFILGGNGSYDNRGCEAIVRGTIKILRNFYPNSKFICISHFHSHQEFLKQQQQEADPKIIHLSSHRLYRNEVLSNFLRPKTYKKFISYISNRNGFYSSCFDEMLPYLDSAIAVLSIGGDTFSLDYGLPSLHTALDDIVLKHRQPIILWGASVGPFTSMPDYERFMANHLRTLTGIYARESSTVDYLKSIGVVENLHHVADPAFLMDPVQPKHIDFEMPDDKTAIGINLSSLIARYVTDGNVNRWAKISASIIESIQQETEMPIYLIPHVINIGVLDDFAFMQKVLHIIPEQRKKVFLISPKYNAAETKWIISKMGLFMGARTHSTIAAMSTGVPTLSLGYSIKAIGINKDIFGHSDFCLSNADINQKKVVERISMMIDSTSQIKQELSKKIPVIQSKSAGAGKLLNNTIKK